MSFTFDTLAYVRQLRAMSKSRRNRLKEWPTH